jgi:transaldolase
MTTLQDLFQREGQSPWIDNIRRADLHNGQMAKMLSQGIRGLTSNPTIFAKAIEGETDYDQQFADLLVDHSVEDAYWDLTITDITGALELLRPLYEQSDAGDGFVSIEVAPSLAHDTSGTLQAARQLHERIAKPNLLVKIPGTAEGIPAIGTMISEGHSINITLLFSVERYGKVIDAYMAGLEEHLASGSSDLSGVHSVASFFVSRVDTEVDRRLEKIAQQGDDATSKEALSLRGKAAVAQARVAYELFKSRFSTPRWKALEKNGARVQRPLWASTSTKNPDYPDLAYVDTLIGPNTVNTMPDQTIAAFLDHGTVKRTVDAHPDDARRTLDRLGDVGVDMADVSRQLEDEGVASFIKSFDEVMQVLTDKANTLSAKRTAR